jgi:hypothetical protein
MVHGALRSHLAPKPAESTPAQSLPSGFYATRYVIAINENSAAARAIRSVERAIERRYPSLKSGLMSVSLTAEEVNQDRWEGLLRRVNRGFNFYLEE